MRAADGSCEFSPKFSIDRGVLQGDIFSPVCFIVGLAALFEDSDITADKGGLRSCQDGVTRVPFQCYTDDAALYTEVNEAAGTDDSSPTPLETDREKLRVQLGGMKLPEIKSRLTDLGGQPPQQGLVQKPGRE